MKQTVVNLLYFAFGAFLSQSTEASLKLVMHVESARNWPPFLSQSTEASLKQSRRAHLAEKLRSFLSQSTEASLKPHGSADH